MSNIRQYQRIENGWLAIDDEGKATYVPRIDAVPLAPPQVVASVAAASEDKPASNVVMLPRSEESATGGGTKRGRKPRGNAPEAPADAPAAPPVVEKVKSDKVYQITDLREAIAKVNAEAGAGVAGLRAARDVIKTITGSDTALVTDVKPEDYPAFMAECERKIAAIQQAAKITKSEPTPPQGGSIF